MNTTIRIAGPLAQNKDIARAIRLNQVLPSLERDAHICLDFSEVTVATQSFIHALISEPVTRFGDATFRKIEFHACGPQVRSAIETVSVYSLRAREFAFQAIPGPQTVGSADVPQADDLSKIRSVVEALADGPLPVGLIARETTFSLRHTSYRLVAGRVLGFIEVLAGIGVIIDRGRQLLETQAGSLQEIRLFRTAIGESDIIRQIAPKLLNDETPDIREIEQSIIFLAGLSMSTAARRARCLLSWRKQALSSQLMLPMTIPRRRPRRARS